MAWLLALDVEGSREYWNGRQGEKGGPSRTPFKSDAYHFRTAEAARECANTHKGLRDSDEWKVVPR